MKTNQFFRLTIIALFFTLLLGACKKESDPGPKTRIVFWTKRQDLSTLKPDCYVDGQLIGRLSQATSAAPLCGEPGSLSADVTPGKHTIEFRLANNQLINADLDVTEGQCRTVELN